MAVHVVDSNFYDDNCADTIDYDVWNKIYEELRWAAYDTSIMLRHDTVHLRTLAFNKDTSVMNLLGYNYYTFIDTSLTTNTYFDFDTINDVLTDKYPRPGYPYNENKVFASTPSDLYLPYQAMTFRVDPNFFYFDQWNQIGEYDTLKINFGDGSGWHTFDHTTVSHQSVTYPTTGEYYINTVVVKFQGGISRSSLARVIVAAEPSVSGPDSLIAGIPWIQAGIYNPCEESGGPLDKTIIYLEGFDAGDYSAKTNRTISDIYASMINNQGLADLRNFGYRFVVVDWINSRRPIEDNAMALVDLIDYLKCQLRNNNGDVMPGTQFVIIGESMGGLVARYAMRHMEDKMPGTCAKDRMHNTRLLITFDTPHKGANIPLAYQHYYRDPGLLSLGATTVTQQFFGFFNNLLLDATSAKQMLLYHVDTRNPITEEYSRHPLGTKFYKDLEDIGNYPRYAKLVALSNGSLSGIGQSRVWDGAQRSANDILLDLDQEGIFKIFGTKIKLLGARFVLNTVPAGNGQICSSEIGTWSIKVKLKWFGLKIKVSTNSLISSYKDGKNMDPFDVIPGGLDGDFEAETSVRNTVSDIFFGGRTPQNNGNGEYELTAYQFHWKSGAGMNTKIKSDGAHFCFVPTYSALDYELAGDYYRNIEAENISTKVSSTPFHVISGITENYFDRRNNMSLLGTGPISLDERLWVHQFNKSHLFVKNTNLGSWRNHHYEPVLENWFYYPGCPKDIARSIRWINREIGDDTLLVENRRMPYRADYDAELYIGVNRRGAYYEYPSSISTLMIPGIYSKDDPFEVTGSARFLARNGNVQYNPPYTGPYSIVPLRWRHCCNGYGPRFRQVDAPTRNNLNLRFEVYPNPVLDNQFIASFSAKEDKASVATLYDMTGKLIIQKSFVVDAETDNFNYPFTLEQGMSPGNYFFIIRNADQTYHKKLVILD